MNDNFNVTCPYCNYEFDVYYNQYEEYYGDEIFTEENYNRQCSMCGKWLVISPSARWTYSIDKYESDEENGIE